MAINLRERAETDLSFTLEGVFALPVVLIGPGAESGVEPAGQTQSVTGQVLYDRRVLNPDTGDEMVIPEPVVSLRRSSLDPVPQPGEKWIVQIPTTPSSTAELETFVVNFDRAPEGGASIGFIRLYLQRATQIDDDEL
jgi:hypothetical protein